MSESEDDRVASLPLEEHTPLTVGEAGLVLDAPPSRWGLWLLAGVVALVLVVLSVAVVRVTRTTPTALVDRAPGTCFEPVVTDTADSVDAAECGPGTARLVQKVPSSTEPDAPYPGGGALRLLGAGACQGAVDADRLVVAIPAPGAWADGDRTVVCTERQ